jgi:sterol desaturase/sphingolipid hydroxylase (fatty acid hydroxylase superfamily)
MVTSRKFNAVFGSVQLLFTTKTGPFVQGFAVWLIGRFCKSPIHLSDSYFPLSLLALVATKDFVDYWFHRAEHSWGWLWSMHSFHHADESVNATTGFRHFWLERPLALFVFAPLGMIFKIDVFVALGFSLVELLNPLYVHLNKNIGFGKFAALLASPQFHRIHHSTERHHYDQNFSGIFPVWDVIFGTFHKPAVDEFPVTGLGEPEPDWGTALIWPLRHVAFLPRSLSSPPASETQRIHR